MQLDVFIPGLSLAFECEAERHLQTDPAFGSSAVTKKKQSEKIRQCKKSGVSLFSSERGNCIDYVDKNSFFVGWTGR
jgi:hypothetical protein